MKGVVLRSLARQYETSASILYLKRHWSASYHLAGLSVEFALKVCIARQFTRNAIPDKKLVLQIYTHELAKLVQLADLGQDRIDAGIQSPTFARFWATVSRWDADSRYRSWSMSEAEDMLEAVTEPTDGVMRWIRSRW